MMKVVQLAALFIVPLISGWPTGATYKSCKSMMPKHSNNKPLSAHLSPYSFLQSTDAYGPGDKVIVYVQAPVGIPFKGMMVQAYDPETNATIGEFLEGKGLEKIGECSSVTHSDNKRKRGAILVWVAPQKSGNVRFRATIVQKFNTFYYGLNAEVQKIYDE